MGPFVFQVPVRPRLASVNDASGDGGLRRVRTRRKRGVSSIDGSRDGDVCLCRRRTPRSCVAPAADRSNKLPFVAAVCIAVAVSGTAAQTAVSATRVNF